MKEQERSNEWACYNFRWAAERKKKNKREQPLTTVAANVIRKTTGSNISNNTDIFICVCNGATVCRCDSVHTHTHLLHLARGCV